MQAGWHLPCQHGGDVSEGLADKHRSLWETVLICWPLASVSGESSPEQESAHCGAGLACQNDTGSAACLCLEPPCQLCRLWVQSVRPPSSSSRCRHSVLDPVAYTSRGNHRQPRAIDGLAERLVLLKTSGVWRSALQRVNVTTCTSWWQTQKGTQTRTLAACT